MQIQNLSIYIDGFSSDNPKKEPRVIARNGFERYMSITILLPTPFHHCPPFPGLYLLMAAIHSMPALSELCTDRPEGLRLPHFDNTAWFFQCVAGIAELHFCPELHSFDASLQKCDRFPKTTTTVEIPTTTSSSVDLLLPPPAKIPSANPVQCPCHDTDTPTYLPDPHHCDRYYLCYHSRPIRMVCCNGYTWHQLHSQCVPTYQSRCGSATPTPHREQQPACPASGRFFYPHPTACEFFYFCENGHRSLQQCDAFFHWDCRKQRCVSRSEAQCITGVPESGRHRYYV